MTKRNIGNEIIKGMEEAIDYMSGKKTRVAIHKVEIPDEIDGRAIRAKLKLSRQKFADCFGFSARTLQHWEQGNRHPHGPARVLLLLLQREPNTIEGILRHRHTKKDRLKKLHRKEAT
ncbi:MAG: transcriptional regulator [Gammaproteobacteria bacterium RIFCSPHIGHO2_12_FULL_37_14]|nr:MAG: transcriptional regulator [Gammaproteobacteria bacterium RIFCSPHIGHO2_12_FULL_37_14]